MFNKTNNLQQRLNTNNIPLFSQKFLTRYALKFEVLIK